MVAYQPPDSVLLMIGASFRGADLVAASRRLAVIARRDITALGRFGVASDAPEQLAKGAVELEGYLKDPVAKKHDSPLQMADVQELFAKIRGWLIEVREIAVINLSHDQPALDRIVSNMPEVADGYPRDVLRELELRLAAAKDLQPRLDDAGLDDRLMGRGRKLALQLKTAIGKEDVDAGNLQFKTRRLYMRKGSLYQHLKRVARAGRCAFRGQEAMRSQYHLNEIEPDPWSLP